MIIVYERACVVNLFNHESLTCAILSPCELMTSL